MTDYSELFREHSAPVVRNHGCNQGIEADLVC